MRKFSYRAIDRTDQSVTGEIEADSIAAALELLAARNLSVQSVQQLDDLAEPRTGEDHTDAANDSLRQSLSEALERPERLLSCLEAFAQEIPSNRRSGQLQSLIESVRQGNQAESFLTDDPRFVPLLASFSKTASTTSLADSLEQVAYDRDRKSVAWRFLTYPLMILGLAFAVLALLSWLVIPEFSRMYGEFGLMLPAPTMALLQFSDWLVTSPLVVLGIAALLFGALAGLLRTWRRNHLSYRVFGRIGASDRADSLAGMTSTVASLVDSGTSLSEALDVAARSDLHPYYRSAVRALGYHAATDSVVPRELLPPNVIYALGIGCQQPANVPMLQELTRSYRQRGHEKVLGWQGIAAASSIIAVGLVVGWALLALFMPLIELISGLS